MSSGALKLTTYFGERERHEKTLLADALFDVYERHQLQISVLLRGIQGFGLTQQLRTDRLLTLSEDLPAVSIAIDTRERIEAALADVIEIKRRGLLTLERTRMLSEESAQLDIPAGSDDAVKLTLYVGRHARVDGKPAFLAACEQLHRAGVAGASVLLGVDGSTGGTRNRARLLARNRNTPLMVVAVGSTAAIGAALPELRRMLDNPPATLERARVCKRDGILLATPHELPGADQHGLPLWQKLTIVTSEAARHNGRAAHLELVRRLRSAKAAGATSMRGIWGFHGDHTPHGDKLLAVRRHVPVLTVTVDTPERTARTFPIVDELTNGGGLVISEIVPALSALVDGEPRRQPHLAQNLRL
ncbi:MAG TPA: DUF190 domain-containing protein [Solirubrobacteraceae bacterium]|nr:DUF190 domain-containing protein [Solirubrobacteraceae bacterium]